MNPSAPTKTSVRFIYFAAGASGPDRRPSVNQGIRSTP